MKKSEPPLRPEQAAVLEILGYLYFRLGNFAKARVIFEALRQLFPQERKIREFLAAISLAEGKAEEALGHLEALPLSEHDAPPESSPLLLMRAKALALAGKTGASRESLLGYLNRKAEGV